MINCHTFTAVDSVDLKIFSLAGYSSKNIYKAQKPDVFSIFSSLFIFESSQKR